MSDVDVLVPRAQAVEAFDVLSRSDWRWGGGRPFEVDFRTRHSGPMVGPNGNQFDLHWGAVFDPALDDDVWSRATPAMLSGQPTSVPSLADQLVLTCLHGLGWYGAPLRWLSDAALLIGRPASHGPPIDWSTVVREARRRGAAHQVASQLELVRQVLGCDIPPDVVVELRAERLKVRDRLVQRAKEYPHGGVTIYVCSWDRARRTAALPVPFRQSSMAFAIEELGVDGHRGLMTEFGTRMLRNLRQAGRQRSSSY